MKLNLAGMILGNKRFRFNQVDPPWEGAIREYKKGIVVQSLKQAAMGINKQKSSKELRIENCILHVGEL